MLPQCQQQDTVIIKRKQSNKINVMKIVSIEISWNRLTVWTVVCKKKKTPLTHPACHSNRKTYLKS